MKKIILSIAILASGVSTYAMSNSVVPTISINSVMNEEFTEVSLDKLPEAIKETVNKDFPAAKIDKAYINESGQYKLELSADGATSTVFIDKDGNWLETSAIK